MIAIGTPVDGAYSQAMDYVSHKMGRTTMAMISLPIVNHHTGGVGPDQTTSVPLLLITMCHHLYILGCRNFVQLVFRSFSVMVALYLVVVLVCPWQEVSPGSTYSPPS